MAGVAAVAAIGGGLLAAVASVGLAEAEVRRAEDRRLGDEAAEIVAEVQGLSGEALGALVAEELHELEPAGLRVAVRKEGVLVGGDATLPMNAEGCTTQREPREMRVCMAVGGPWSCAVATGAVPSLGGRAMGTIVLGAVVVAALIGVIASRMLAGWAVGPLARLGQRIGDAPLDEAVDLGADEGVHEIDALRQTLRALLDRRTEALRAARLFAAGAAHELRTPLTTLSGELELLAEESLPGPALGRIAALRAITGRIGRLVERLLVLARVGAAEAMRHDAVEIGEVLEELAHRLPAEATERLTLSLEGQGTVRGDESLLAVLCENLMHNALVHARPAAVRVVLREEEETVLLDVIDEGPGIPAAERARLFAPFQRGAAAGPGEGLGLALVAQIARAHGGEVLFQDAPRGTHLRVRLPRWSPRAAAPVTLAVCG
ncbi:Tricarboxylate transport sensor protein TctE [Chondromyces apiculatus DSM 436]|uniref:histidine kinase n=1 Tax=Chondromyces apiculatus DSM 436 TaxID=1192034 RepID=A0A017SYB9_9BACT|nr:Tricarboxylate transport sensor protein TctE [Chondromyces apiculatus DSM 436]